MVNDKLEMADRTRQSEEPNKPAAKGNCCLSVCLSVLLSVCLPACLPFFLPRQKDALEAAGQLLRIFIPPLWQQEISQLQLQLLLKLTKALKNKQTAIEQFEGRLSRMRQRNGGATLLEGCCRISAATCCCCCCCLLGLAVAPSQLCSAFSLPVPVALCEKSFSVVLFVYPVTSAGIKGSSRDIVGLK